LKERTLVKDKKKTCFVIMPFGDLRVDPQFAARQDSIYSKWIKPTVESITNPRDPDYPFVCHRADRDMRPGEIIVDILEALTTFDIVIADLSGKNPNVFYELGVRHAVSNNTILIADDLSAIPFDLRGLRTIVYSYDPDGMLRLRDSLSQAIVSLLQNPRELDNPVRRHLYQNEVVKLQQQRIPPGYDVIREILGEVTSLRTQMSKYAEEFAKVRDVIVTLTSQTHTAGSLPSHSDLKPFEGVWTDLITQSTFCVSIHENSVLIPYSFASTAILTGVVHNCKVVGKTLFGRFKWFDHPISGFVFAELVQSNRMDGGWWYDEELPADVTDRISTIKDSLPGMKPLLLAKAGGRHKFPVWATDFMSRVSTQGRFWMDGVFPNTQIGPVT